MTKYGWLFFWSCAIFFLVPLFAHADDLNYDMQLNGYYWGAHTSTPVYSKSAASYGVDADVRFKGTAASNWGFGLEFQSVTSGPTFSSITSPGTANTFSVPGSSSGSVSSNSMQFGGGKVKYFFPTEPKTNIAAYLGYFVSSGNRSAFGGGLEGSYQFTRKWSGSAFLDFDNVTGSVFPSQNLIRYDLRAIYHFPNTDLQGFLGYRHYSYSQFFATTISGVELGLGTHW